MGGRHRPQPAAHGQADASGSALVDRHAGGTWKAPPGVFPAFAIPGTTQEAVRHDPVYRIDTNHFATVEFQGSGWSRRIDSEIAVKSVGTAAELRALAE